MGYLRGRLHGGPWARCRYRPDRRRWLAAGIALVAVLGGLFLAGRTPGHGRPSKVTAPAPAAAAGAVRLYVEPEAGYQPITALIASARATIRLSVYELRDPAVEHALTAAARRGVRVQVVLDASRERSPNQLAYTYLTAHRVPVAWSPASFAADHAKALTVDQRAAAIFTGNLVASDYPDTRDVLLVDRDRADVAAIAATIAADAAHTRATPPAGADLVWSPIGSQAAILKLIGHARRRLLVEAEEMADPDLTAALVAAARRGVAVRVVMTTEPCWRAPLARLRSAGAHVVTYPDAPGVLYIHAKVLVADPGTPAARALIGSQNFSVASLRYNRELGLLTGNRRSCRPQPTSSTRTHDEKPRMSWRTLRIGTPRSTGRAGTTNARHTRRSTSPAADGQPTRVMLRRASVREGGAQHVVASRLVGRDDDLPLTTLAARLRASSSHIPAGTCSLSAASPALSHSRPVRDAAPELDDCRTCVRSLSV